LQWQFDLLGIEIEDGPPLTDVLVVQRERCKTLREMAEKSRYFFGDLPEYDHTQADKYLTAESIPLLRQFRDKLMTITDWQPAVLHDCLKACVEAAGIGLGQLAQPVRFAVTGTTVSPSVDLTLALLGKEKTLIRLEKGLREFNRSGVRV
jgi:glutamyl-tRNA synthetase